MHPPTNAIRTAAFALALAGSAALFAPLPASAQSFYVTAVRWEGTSEGATASLEATLPEAARRCANAGSARRLALGERAVIVRVGPDGSTLGVEVRSDDVSPSRVESTFARCLERAVTGRRYEPPVSQPATIEVRVDYARAVPDALRPGGDGVRREPLERRAPPTTSTGMPPDDVRRVAEEHSSEIGRCIEANVRDGRALTGRVEFDLTLEPGGRVEMISIVQSTTDNEGFDRCMLEAVRTWTFPAPGARIAMRYPLSVASRVRDTAP